jgi:hypothetical protein
MKHAKVTGNLTVIISKCVHEVTSVMKMGKLKNLSLFETTVGAWAMLTKGTQWLMAIQLIRECGSGQKIILPVGSNYTE